MEVRAGRPRRRGRRQRVGHVHPGPAAERGRDEVRVQDGHRPRPELEHDQLALVGLLEHERRAAAAGVAVDPVEAVLALLGGHAEVHDPARAVAAHPGDVRIVGVEHRGPRPRHGLDDTALTFASWPIESMPPRPRWSPVTLVTTATSLRS